MFVVYKQFLLIALLLIVTHYQVFMVVAFAATAFLSPQSCLMCKVSGVAHVITLRYFSCMWLLQGKDVMCFVSSLLVAFLILQGLPQVSQTLLFCCMRFNIPLAHNIKLI